MGNEENPAESETAGSPGNGGGGGGGIPNEVFVQALVDSFKAKADSILQGDDTVTVGAKIGKVYVQAEELQFLLMKLQNALEQQEAKESIKSFEECSARYGGCLPGCYQEFTDCWMNC